MLSMRTKDEQKREALFEATVKLVNEIGFASSSVSKIAKEAVVSPSTIYVFFKNKEDLLVSTYLEIKRNMAEALLEDFDDKRPIRDIMRSVWYSIFDYISNNPEYFEYIEQFANSPYESLVDKEALDRYFIPILGAMERGIEQKIIKDVKRDLLSAFMWSPISRLANPRLCHGLDLNDDDLETAFTMAWDAIKL